jgi:hypothetical protein
LKSEYRGPGFLARKLEISLEYQRDPNSGQIRLGLPLDTPTSWGDSWFPTLPIEV